MELMEILPQDLEDLLSARHLFDKAEKGLISRDSR
jgi:hypothetical protein